MSLFTCTFQAGWGDMDYNGHMRNTAYLDKSGDARMLYFQSNGFSMPAFIQLNIGPVIMKDEISYFKELKLLDQMDVTLALAGLSGDGSRFRLRNVFFRKDGKMAAQVTSTGGWLDLAARRLVSPPEELIALIKKLETTDDYVELP